MELQFNDLPKAVSDLQKSIDEIRRILLDKSPTTSKELDELLTIEQASVLLNLSKATLYGYVHNSTIPVSKRGKRLYFSKLELLDWIKEGRRKTVSEIAQQATKRLQRNGL